VRCAIKRLGVSEAVRPSSHHSLRSLVVIVVMEVMGSEALVDASTAVGLDYGLKVGCEPHPVAYLCTFL